MPRPSPLVRLPMPEMKAAPLTEYELHRFANLLGLDVLPDACAHGIAWLIAAHHASRKLVKAHAPARVGADRRRTESCLRPGKDDPTATQEIMDPPLGVDVETYSWLQPVIIDPRVPLDRKLAALEARRREVEGLPAIDACHALRVVLVAQALVWVWIWFAVRHNDAARQWRFILAVLEAAGEGTERLRQHPERLKRDVGQLLHMTAQPGGSA